MKNLTGCLGILVVLTSAFLTGCGAVVNGHEFIVLAGESRGAIHFWSAMLLLALCGFLVWVFVKCAVEVWKESD